MLNTLISIILLAVVIYLGFKMLKNMIAAIIIGIILAFILYYFGYLLPF